MDSKFIITPKIDRAVTITIRLPAALNKRIEDMALKSGYSRNALINKALEYAFDHIEFIIQEQHI